MALLDKAEALHPGNPDTVLNRAVVLGRMGDAQAALALLETPPTPGMEPTATEWLERGRLLDRVGRTEDAFAAFSEGKRRLREATGQSYMAEHARHTAQRLRGFFIADRLRTLPQAGLRRDVAQPLFVLGFPRSGTTLTEQTLSAHPAIAAGDELPIVAEITGLMPRMLDSPLTYPDALAALESIARHIVLVADLVAHYRAQMNLRYLAVRYEDMVDDQEATIRRILDFVGEEFDPGCLAFHENTRYARTAATQVSEKLYDRSRFRYLKYLPQLQPVIPVLRPVVERLGYTV